MSVALAFMVAHPLSAPRSSTTTGGCPVPRPVTWYDRNWERVTMNKYRFSLDGSSINDTVRVWVFAAPFDMVPSCLWEWCKGSRNPRPVTESPLASSMVLGLGKWFSWVELPKRYWSKLRKNRTVPSAKPTARCDIPWESATVETGWGRVPVWIFAERSRGGASLDVCSRSQILRIG